MRRRSLKRVGAIAIPTLALAMLAGCSSTGSVDAGSGKTSTKMSANLTYALWDSNQVAAATAQIKQFNQTDPNIKVTIEQSPFAQYWSKMQTEATANTMPDVFWMNPPELLVYAAGNKLADLTPLTKSGAVKLSNYPTSLDDIAKVNGVLYGVPKDFDTQAVWYNKALFTEAGVPLPTADWTWTEFQTDAKKISDALKSKGVYGVAADLTNGQQSYWNTILEAGGNILSTDKKTALYDTPASIKGLTFWSDLIANGSSPTMAQMSDTSPDQLFASGKVAMLWGGSWWEPEMATSPVAKSISVVQLPSDVKKAGIINGLTYAMAANGKNQAAATTFITYLGSEAAAETQARVGGAIPAFNGTQTAWVNSVPSFDLKVFIDSLKYAVPETLTSNTTAWTDAEGKDLQAAFSGQTPTDQVAKQLTASVNKILASQ